MIKQLRLYVGVQMLWFIIRYVMPSSRTRIEFLKGYSQASKATLALMAEDGFPPKNRILH
jgi:hypothetical protein